MRRPVLLLLCLVLVLQFAGCAVEANVSAAPSPTPRSTATPKPAATPKPFDGSGLVWQETPGSTCFSYIAYDPGHKVLAVIFRSNTTRTYLYYDFTASDWKNFTAADSLGSYYNKNIKGQYSGERIDDIEGTYFEP